MFLYRHGPAEAQWRVASAESDIIFQGMSRRTFVTDFLRLKIDFQDYQRLVEAETFFASIERHIADAVTGRRGDMDWYESAHKFFTCGVEPLWRRMKD